MVQLGHFAVGLPLMCLGKFTAALPHLQRGSLTAWHAVGLWYTGHADQARQMLQSALHEPHSTLRQAVYLMCASTLHQLCREWIKAHQYAAALIALATEHTLPMLLAQGTILQGCALAGLNSDADPLSHIQQGLQDLPRHWGRRLAADVSQYARFRLPTTWTSAERAATGQ